MLEKRNNGMLQLKVHKSLMHLDPATKNQFFFAAYVWTIADNTRSEIKNMFHPQFNPILPSGVNLATHLKVVRSVSFPKEAERLAKNAVSAKLALR